MIFLGGVDLIVVPGMAFTRDGKRLGHGKGYYDRFIKELKNINCKPKTYAVGFHQQVLEDVPVDDYDQIIDSIITADS